MQLGKQEMRIPNSVHCLHQPSDALFTSLYRSQIIPRNIAFFRFIGN